MIRSGPDGSQDLKGGGEIGHRTGASLAWRAFRLRAVKEAKGRFTVVTSDLAELVKDEALVSFGRAVIAGVDGLQVLTLPSVAHVDVPPVRKKGGEGNMLNGATTLPLVTF